MTINSVFKGMPLFDVEYLRNNTRIQDRYMTTRVSRLLTKRDTWLNEFYRFGDNDLLVKSLRSLDCLKKQATFSFREK